jgi:hypothetical protein
MGMKLSRGWLWRFQNGLSLRRRENYDLWSLSIFAARMKSFTVWLAELLFRLAAGHVTLHSVLGLARIEVAIADSKGIGAG